MSAAGPFQLCCLRVSKLGWVSRFSACEKVLNHVSGAQVFFALALRPGGMRAPQIGGFLRSFREQAGHTGYFTPVGSLKSHIPSIQGVLHGVAVVNTIVLGAKWLFEEHTGVKYPVRGPNGFLGSPQG